MAAEHGKRIWGTLDPFVESGTIIGRKVANAGFLRALFDLDPFDGYDFFVLDVDSVHRISNFVSTTFPGLRSKVRVLPRTALPSHLASTPYHCFHLSDCLTTQGWLAALRNRVAPEIFPITGVTHSLSYARFGPAFAQHVWPGVTERDCIVATSRAGQEVVRRHLAHVCHAMPAAGLPEVARVPLGVWCREYAAPSGAKVHGVPEDATAVLVPGRISPYSKMDLLPLLRAFQRLARQGVDLRTVCLILAGSTEESGGLPGILTNLAANIGLRLVVVRCPDNAARDRLLHRADMVVSLADNPQETFGLTLLEAQAAGKPVIASDYDGYRDLIEDGESGFLVPTLDSGGDALTSLMAPLLYDSDYHLWMAQDVAVDVAVLARHVRTLLDPEVRARMGRFARVHARNFDWPVIMGHYMDLWDELWERPALAPSNVAHPLMMDYALVFEGYSTQRLGDGDLLRISALGRAVQRGRDHPVLYSGMESRVDLDLMRAVLVWTRSAIAWSALRQKAGDADPERLRITVMWMLKGDMLERGGTQQEA